MSDDSFRVSDRPLVSGAVGMVVAALVFGGLDFLVTGQVDPLLTLLFAVVFAVTYVSVAVYRDR